MGRFFTSFEEAWESFLNRREDLEDFFAPFPEDDHFLLGWLLRPEDGLLPAVRRVQRSFSHLAWITLQPEHFLHTWIAGVAFGPRRPTTDEIATVVERAGRAWLGLDPFDIRYRRINCFHTAVVAEVRGDGPRRLVSALAEADFWTDLPLAGATSGVQLETFLPHLTLGAFRGANEPTPLRKALVPIRKTELGRQRVTEATLCLVPASRTTIFDPWEVVGFVALG